MVQVSISLVSLNGFEEAVSLVQAREILRAVLALLRRHFAIDCTFDLGLLHFDPLSNCACPKPRGG